MRYIVFFTILAVLVGGFVGAIGLGVAASGLIPIKASSGHWAITEWMLHFSMRRSIATHTIGDELPPLDDAAWVLRGAGHYEAGCKPCHGSPELVEPRVARIFLDGRLAGSVPLEEDGFHGRVGVYSQDAGIEATNLRVVY